MTAQAIQGTTSQRFISRGMPRKLSVAVTAAAIPAFLLSALALADPAHAAPAGNGTAVFTQMPVQAPQKAAAVVVPSRVAAQIPVIVAAEAGVPATHRIEAGDTVSSIAARYGLSQDEVLSANNLQPTSLIFAGEELRLTGSASAAPAAPAASSASGYTVVAGDTLGGIAAAQGVSLDSVLAANGLTMTSVIHPGQQISFSGGSAPSAAPASAAPAASHTVEPGDTLTGIAASHNIGLAELMSANGMNGSTVLHPGDVVVLSGGASVTTLAYAPAEAAQADLVPNTFLHYTYPDAVVADANVNKQSLNNSDVPDRAQMQQIVAQTAAEMGVDPALALAFSYQESGFDQRAVSPANAIGAMQVIPSSGDWASDLVGRDLNLLDPYDNATAGVAIISSLMRTTGSLEDAVASYYQGQYSVDTQGMFPDTRNYVASVLAHRQSFS